MMNTTTETWRMVVAGAWRFTLVSVAGFAPWACARCEFCPRGSGWNALYGQPPVPPRVPFAPA